MIQQTSPATSTNSNAEDEEISPDGEDAILANDFENLDDAMFDNIFVG